MKETNVYTRDKITHRELYSRGDYSDLYPQLFPKTDIALRHTLAAAGVVFGAGVSAVGHFTGNSYIGEKGVLIAGASTGLLISGLIREAVDPILYWARGAVSTNFTTRKIE